MACILHTVRFRHRFQRLAAAEMRRTIEEDYMGSVPPSSCLGTSSCMGWRTTAENPQTACEKRAICELLRPPRAAATAYVLVKKRNDCNARA